MATQLTERPLGKSRARELPLATEAFESTAPAARHNWLLYVFLFLLPLQNLQTGHMPSLPGGINFLNIGFVLALIGAWRCRGHLTRWSSLHRWVWLYLVCAAVSLLIGFALVPESDEILRANALKDSALGVLLLFVVELSVTDWSTLRRVVLMTILPLPYILHVTWSQHQSVASWHYEDDLRISGTLSLLGANEFASFCVTMALVLFAILLATRLSKVWRMLLLLGIGCMVMAVLWAYSRTAYVAIMAGAVLILLLWRGRWKIAIPLMLTVLIVPNILPQAVIERFDSTHVEGGKVDESTEMRYAFWDVAWNHFLHHPVFGTGYGTFNDVNPYSKDTHNFFLRELTEKGLIGFFITLGMFFGMARACWRTFKDSAPGSFGYALALGMCGAWIALVIGNCWGDRFTYTQMIGYFWVFLALTLKAREFALAERAGIAPDVAPAVSAAITAPTRFAQPRRPARLGLVSSFRSLRHD